MVFKKYIKRDGKVYGPYLYENKRVNGKVVTTYIGRGDKKSRVNKKEKFFSYVGVIVLFCILFFSYIYVADIKTGEDIIEVVGQLGYYVNEVTRVLEEIIQFNPAGGPVIFIDTCGATIDVEDATYILTNDVGSVGDCFDFNAKNITLDGNSFKATGSGGGRSVDFRGERGLVDIKVHHFKDENYPLSLDGYALGGGCPGGSIAVTDSDIGTIDVGGNTVGTICFAAPIPPFEGELGHQEVKIFYSNFTDVTTFSGVLYAGNVTVEDNIINMTGSNMNLACGNCDSTGLLTLNYSIDFIDIDANYGSEIRLHIQNRLFGEIKWDDDIIPDSLTNISKHSEISQNFLFFNETELPQLNKGAIAILYNNPGSGLTNPAVLRYGRVCRECVNFTSLFAEEVIFSVERMGEYSIGEAPELDIIVLSPLANFNVLFNTTYLASLEVTCSITDCGGMNISVQYPKERVIVDNSGFEDPFFGWLIEDWENSGTFDANLSDLDAHTGMYSLDVMHWSSQGGGNIILSQIFEEVAVNRLKYYIRAPQGIGDRVDDRIEISVLDTNDIWQLIDIHERNDEFLSWNEFNSDVPSTVKGIRVAGFNDAGGDVETPLLDDFCFTDELNVCLNHPFNFTSEVDAVTPFYTLETNPQFITLAVDETQIVNFDVNATGDIGYVQEFLGHGLLDDGIISAESTHWTATIVGDISEVSSCRTLDVPNVVYSQIQNIIPLGPGPCINITAENVTFDGKGYWIANDAVNEIGIYSNQYNSTIIGTNVSMGDSGLGIGVEIEYSNYSTIYNNTLNSQANGIIVFESDFVIVEENEVKYNREGIIVTGSDNGLYSNNDVSENRLGENSVGMYFQISDNNVIIGNTIENNLLIGIGFIGNPSEGNTVIDNVIRGNGVFGLSLYIGSNKNKIGYNELDLNGRSISVSDSSNNTFRDLVIHNSQIVGIEIYNPTILSSFNNSFINLTVTNTDNSGLDINFSNPGIEETYIVDTYLESYEFDREGSKVVFRDSDYGEIIFLEALNGSGSNLSDDIRIGSNLVTVESERNPGLNKSANITFTGVPSFENPRIARNGFDCEGVCSNYTSLEGPVVEFNVSYWTNYSIEDEPPLEVSNCRILNESNRLYLQTKNIIPPGPGACIVITAENITFDGDGYWIANGVLDVEGINSSQYNSTIRDVNVSMGDSVGGIGIKFSGAINGTIENSIFNLNGDSGVYLEESTGILLSDNELNSNGIFGINMLSANENQMSGGIINSTGTDAIYLEGLNSDGNVFSDIVISNTNDLHHDIHFATEGIDETKFIDMHHIGNYTFTGLGGKLIVSNTDGEINFVEAVNGSGNNLTKEIRIENNLVTVDSDTNPGLNRTANITMNGIPGFANPKMLRNGFTCLEEICTNFSSLEGPVVEFNVSYWTNYSIGEDFPMDMNPPVISNAEINDSSPVVLNTVVKVNATVIDVEDNLETVTIEIDPPLSDPYNTTAEQNGNEFFNVTNLLDQIGIWTFRFYANDTSGNEAIPVLAEDKLFNDFIEVAVEGLSTSYVPPTETSGVRKNRDFIEVNVTAVDEGVGISEIEIRLYDSEHMLLDNSVTATSPNYVNFSDLVDGFYYYNATAENNFATEFHLETRNITLDNISPIVNITVPLEGQVFDTDSYPVGIEINESGNCEYSLDSGVINFSMTSNFDLTTFSDTQTDVSDGDYVLYAYCRDLAGNMNNTENVSFGVVIPTPGTTGGSGGSSGSGSRRQEIANFTLDRELIVTSVKQGEAAIESIIIQNIGEISLHFNLTGPNGIERFMRFTTPKSFSLHPDESALIGILFFAEEDEPGGIHAGNFGVDAGLIRKNVNVVIEIVEKEALFDLESNLKRDVLRTYHEINPEITLLNLGERQRVDVKLEYFIKDFENEEIKLAEELFRVDGDVAFDRQFKIPRRVNPEEYVFYTKLTYRNSVAASANTFVLLPNNLWIYILVALLIIGGTIGIMWYFDDELRRFRWILIAGREALKTGKLRDAVAKYKELSEQYYYLFNVQRKKVRISGERYYSEIKGYKREPGLIKKSKIDKIVDFFKGIFGKGKKAT